MHIPKTKKNAFALCTWCISIYMIKPYVQRSFLSSQFRNWTWFSNNVQLVLVFWYHCLEFNWKKQTQFCRCMCANENILLFVFFLCAHFQNSLIFSVNRIIMLSCLFLVEWIENLSNARIVMTNAFFFIKLTFWILVGNTMRLRGRGGR